VNVDVFMSKLGIAQLGEVSPEALRTLCEKAEAFIRAGVVLTFDDCMGMNEATLTAFIRARELVEEESRALFVAAFQAPAIEAALDQQADQALDGLVRSMDTRRAS
jgi:hypothetical protein